MHVKPTSTASNVPEEKKSFKAFVFRILSVLLGLLVAVVLAEYGIRIFAPQELVSDVIELDSDLDYKLRPNARGHMISPEFSAQIRVNSLGFRGEEFSLKKTPGVSRILFLGDSFTFGDGLKENETLPFLVGQELNRGQPGKFEVINGGVYGYATAQELSLFLKYGLPLQPDVVVILVMIHDMVANGSWYELTNDGHLKRKPRRGLYRRSRQITKYIPGSAWLREHSHLFKFVGMRLLCVSSGRGSGQKVRNLLKEDIFSPEFYQDEHGPFRITTLLLSQLAKTAKECGAKPVLLTLQSKWKTVDGRVSPGDMLPHEQLGTAAREIGFLEAMALPPILASYDGDENLFYPVDGHWTPAAIHLVAPVVADVILRVSDPRLITP